MEDYAKRYVTKDRKQRITIYRDDYAENPRWNTDEPLHCADWSREYSIMSKDEREYKCSDARTLICRLLGDYGKREVIIDMLVENGKHLTDGKSVCDNALVYDKSLRGWALKEYTNWYGEKEYNWKDATFFDGRKDDIDLYSLLDMLLDGTLDELCDKKYWTDGVKIVSYDFGYYGSISFDDDFGTNSSGIAWLEKDEFLKYSGCEEDYWASKTLREIEWLTDELEAWGDNEVYGFKVEKAIRTITNVRYPDGERDDTEEEDVVWEETDSCWGFYGELDKQLDNILDNAGFKKEELIEE